jgi:hypothetical protein
MKVECKSISAMNNEKMPNCQFEWAENLVRKWRFRGNSRNQNNWKEWFQQKRGLKSISVMNKNKMPKCQFEQGEK